MTQSAAEKDSETWIELTFDDRDLARCAFSQTRNTMRHLLRNDHEIVDIHSANDRIDVSWSVSQLSIADHDAT